jgi:alkylation response protein AidB-like acyl-CoA dehydrogenase
LDFSLSNEQEMLKQMIERFNVDRGDGQDDAASRWSLLADLGVLGLPFSVEQGGLGGDAVDTIAVMEALGRGFAPEPVVAELYLGAGLLAAAGGDVSAVIAGKAHYLAAISESAARDRFDAIATSATERHDTWVITGAKSFVLGSAAPTGYVVSAMSGDRLGLFLVAADAPGVARENYCLIDDSPAAEVTFRDTPAQRLAGGRDELYGALDTVRLAVAAEMLGTIGRLFEDTLDYLRTRHQFGVAIGSFQALQHRMADLYANLEQSRSLLYRAALAEEQERSAAIAAVLAYVGAVSIGLAEECVQFHGGMGVSDELSIGQGLKRVLVLANLFGHPDDALARYAALSKAASADEAEQAGTSNTCRLVAGTG